MRESRPWRTRNGWCSCAAATRRSTRGVLELVVDSELSIGDYVLSGGEAPAMVVIEAISRQVPGVVGRQSSVANESFRTGMLDHPHYTRPPVVEGIEAPEVLRSGGPCPHRRMAP